jgi:hypothetical protein
MTSIAIFTQSAGVPLTAHASIDVSKKLTLFAFIGDFSVMAWLIALRYWSGQTT